MLRHSRGLPGLRAGLQRILACCGLALLFSASPSFAQSTSGLKNTTQAALTTQVTSATSATSQSLFEGELEVLHWDNRDKTSITKQFLRTADGKRYELRIQGRALHYRSGTKLRVKGSLSGSTLALSSDGTSTQVLAAAPTTSLGVQKVAVILVNFQDNTVQPATSAEVQNVVFTTVNNFYKENSFQQTSLSGNVYGWYTIPVSSSICPALDTIANNANSAATAAGADLTQYTRVVYMFPLTMACSWSGMATVGGGQTRAFINGSFDLGTIGHELGHNLGLAHSHGLACGTNIIGTNCTNVEYGDEADIMGSTATHFNAVQKERLGWLNAAGLPPITTVQSDGTYNLDPYETVTNNPKALKILKSTNSTTGVKTWYYVEFRQAIGFDSTLANVGNLVNGVLVHTGTDGDVNSSNLLDMTPNNNTYISSFADATLLVGQSFTDPTAGVTITPSWVNSTGAGVTVTLSQAPAQTSCTRAKPSVVISSSQSTSVSAGASVSYIVAVTNNDSTACGSSTFSLQKVVPTGWTGTLASSSLSIAAGSASSTTLTVTSPSTATAGSYTISATATNAASTANSATATGSYVIGTSSSTTTSTKGKGRTK